MEPISRIDPEKGILYYRGVSVSEIVRDCSFESVLYLLINGKEANEHELTRITQQLMDARLYFAENIESMREERLDYGLSILVLLADALDTIQQEHRLDEYSTMLTMVSCTPLAVAYDYHLDYGTEPVLPNPDLHHAENLLWMLTGRVPNTQELRDVEDCLILHMEDPENPSLTALRSSLDGSGSLASALSSALREHSGPLHHGAGTEAALMLDELWLTKDPKEAIRNRLTKGEKLYGLGHRIYKTYDPRARILREMLLRRHRIGEEYVKFIDWIAAEGGRQLQESKGINAHPNVDLFNAITYGTFGLLPSLNTELFAVSRVAGWMAHAWQKFKP